MQAKTEIQQGWEFMARMLGADVGSHRAFSDFIENTIQNESIQAQNAHIQQINDAIDQLARNINEHPQINMDVERFKGFVAEEMHAGKPVPGTALRIRFIRDGIQRCICRR